MDDIDSLKRASSELRWIEAVLSIMFTTATVDHRESVDHKLSVLASGSKSVSKAVQKVRAYLESQERI